MTMRVRSVEEQDKARTVVKFVSVQVLVQREAEIHRMIAQRAYELFERRGRVPNHEIDDWVQAESELVYPCCHDLEESAEAVTLHVDLPGSLTADQLTVSVERRRLLVSSEKEISLLYGDESDAHWEVRLQQIFRAHDLPADVDPSEAKATQEGHGVNIVLPKASAANERIERARSASSGR
jgi:HSP20 family molecular chaperone IbpA